MSATAIPPLLQHVRRLAVTGSSDEQLLSEFLASRSDEAFSAILGRHGPMVLNVCRRILHDAQAAEDVFQATFLVLANRAGAIQRRTSLAGFLHGVAYRLARRARPRSMQSLPATLCDVEVDPGEKLSWKEMLGILDQELGQVSDRYRAPLVLCYLEGRTQDEAARQLGWSLNTLRRRLAQGRRLLEARLRGRGVTLPAALAGLLAAGAVAVPGPLRAATLAAACAPAAGALTAGLSSAWEGFFLSLVLSTSAKKVAVLVAVAVLGAFCVAAGWTSHREPASEVPHTTPADPATAPLPSQGASRIGTDSYRHGTHIASMAVSADGKLAVTASGYGSFNPTLAGRFSPARVFDLTDGRCLYSLPNEPGEYTEAVGLSPDGKILATKDGKFLTFSDAATGKELRKLKYLSGAGGGRSITDWMTFTPDGKHLAATLMGDAVQLIDVETAQVIRTFTTGGAASACDFSPDGKRMATGGYDLVEKVYHVRVWDVGTGKELRRFPAAQFPVGNGVKRALAFSPDGATLAGGGWGDARLRLWETDSGKEPMVFPRIGEEIVSVAVAPDGKTVAVAADKIYLYDPATGKERLQIDRRARGLAFSSDGSVLTGAVSGAIYRWDTASGRQLTPVAAQDSAVEQILVGADGRVFTTDQDGKLHVWDAAGKSSRRVAEGVVRGVVTSRDSRFLAWASRDVTGNSRIRLYDIAAERFLDRFPLIGGEATVAAFLPDGKSLLTLEGGPPTFRHWDVESGKQQRSFTAIPPKSVGDPGFALFVLPSCTPRRVAASPDGKTLAIGPDFPEGFLAEGGNLPVCLWDVATGKAGPDLHKPIPGAADVPDEAGTGKVERLGRGARGGMKSVDGRAFSSDGRFLVDWAENAFGRSRMDHVYVWNAVTGRAVATLEAGPRPGGAHAAFAPDGRTFAIASADGVVRLWEVATWKVRAEFRGHRDRVTAVAFGPEGKLFTGGLDTVVLGWDVQPPRDAARGSLAEAWEALTKTDGKASFQAQGRFLAEPARAIEWFATRLPAASPPPPARVRALIADLDQDDFATRERATAELKEHGPAVVVALRELLEKAPSMEARRRAESLLRDGENGDVPPLELRALRAVEVLEWIATPEARTRLLELAKGTPNARLTREAAASSKRLEGRK